jgi:histidine triad (HIT) family protein
MASSSQKYAYDKSNVFAAILHGDIPYKKIRETEYSLAFHDVSPLVACHALVIPKGFYVNFDHFVGSASVAEQLDFFATVRMVIKDLNLVNENEIEVERGGQEDFDGSADGNTDGNTEGNTKGSTGKTSSRNHDGCRLISNIGSDGGQEVPHFHVHILGGEILGKMLVKQSVH